jgi:Tol biopolymer transport system component
MNQKYFISPFLLFVIMFTLCQAQEGTKDKSEFPVLKGPYLGQKPPGLIPEVFAPGIVSRSDYHEHSSPAFSPDGKEVYWSAHVGPRKQRIFFMKLSDGCWTEPEIVSFWKDRHGGGPVFTPDGKRLVFYSTYPESHLAGEEFMNIWFIERLDSGWGKPKKMNAIINTDKGESSPSFTNEGSIYFNSGCDGGMGKADIYYSEYINGQFVEPRNLGEAINTINAEYGGCISPDESYIMFSRYTEDPNGVSIYISFRKSNGTWTKAQNMGDKIKLCKKGRFPGISPDGKYVFFCAYEDRDVEIYWVDAKIIDQFKPVNLL